MTTLLNESKITCLCLPCQSGKTRKVEDLMKIQNGYGDADVHFWISTNNKTLTRQTATRFKNNVFSSDDDTASTVSSLDDNNVSDDKIVDNVFSWTSGNKATNIKAAELALHILNEDVNMVVICANAKRIKHLNDVIHMLTKNRAFAQHKKINIWIDEADQTIKVWKKLVAEMQNVSLVTSIMLISATIEPLVKLYSSLKVIPFEKTYPQCYRKLSDCFQVAVEYAASTPAEYVKYILEENPELCQAGCCAFVPGTVMKESHEQISQLLMEKGFSVVILNGDKKEIRIQGGAVIDLTPYITVSDDGTPIEFNETLAQLYKTHKLAQHPFAITGHLCVQRGITFQIAASDGHDGFLFDCGIIPPIASKAEAYQLISRMFGNIGNFPNYKSSTIYTGSAMFKKVETMENIAINLAKMVHDKDLIFVTKSHLKEAGLTEDESVVQQHHDKCSQPIVFLTLDKKDKIKVRDTASVMSIVQRIRPDMYEKYKNYSVHCWNLDTESKCNKWGLNRMKEPNARSTTTNMDKKEILKDSLMIYHYENQLILKPWNGTAV